MDLSVRLLCVRVCPRLGGRRGNMKPEFSNPKQKDLWTIIFFRDWWTRLSWNADSIAASTWGNVVMIARTHTNVYVHTYARASCYWSSRVRGVLMSFNVPSVSWEVAAPVFTKTRRRHVAAGRAPAEEPFILPPRLPPPPCWARTHVLVCSPVCLRGNHLWSFPSANFAGRQQVALEERKFWWAEKREWTRLQMLHPHIRSPVRL